MSELANLGDGSLESVKSSSHAPGQKLNLQANIAILLQLQLHNYRQFHK